MLLNVLFSFLSLLYLFYKVVLMKNHHFYSSGMYVICKAYNIKGIYSQTKEYRRISAKACLAVRKSSCFSELHAYSKSHKILKLFS